MCGIAGWIGLHESAATLWAMTNSMYYRGPDGDGHVILNSGSEREVAFGHRRLSIIDIQTGNQPMQSHDGRYTIVFNGEIYNYIEIRTDLEVMGSKFQTPSDTEVILEAWRVWGAESLNRFRGMFAFALHDRVDNSVFLARDPFGKKPLFYSVVQTRQGQGLVFGSEIVAMFANPEVSRALDHDSLHDFLCWGYVPGPNTFFRHIRKLPPGNLIHWKDGQWKEWRYWTPPEAEGGARSQVGADPVAQFLEIFDDAVRLRLRADVPVGAFLSGGLDSSAVVATLRHLGAPSIHTFSVGFRGDPGAELADAEETARIMGTTHIPVELDVDHMIDLLPKLSRHRGSPMSCTADMPIYMMSLEASRHVKVVLSGEGSDELFAGYPKHLAESVFGRLASVKLADLTGKALLTTSQLAPGLAGRMGIAARALSEGDFKQRMVRWFGTLTAAERSDAWIGPQCTRALDRTPFSAAPGASPLRQVLHFDQTSWLPDNLLERMDRMTMAASIEGRAPFMDVRLAQFAASLPDQWKLHGLTTKRIAREAMRTRLPAAVLQRPKNGFRMPVASWFRGPLRQQFNDLLMGPDAITRDFIDQSVLQRYALQHAGGQQDHSKILWSLFTLEIFLREFFEGQALDADFRDHPAFQSGRLSA